MKTGHTNSKCFFFFIHFYKHQCRKRALIQDHQYRDVRVNTRQISFSSSSSFFFFYASVNMSGFLGDSQEKAGLLESAGPETAPPGPPQSYAGHACVSTERVRVCDVALGLSVHIVPSVERLNVMQFFFSLSPLSWTYGSNSLPTAGSVSGGVARRGQRQFQMPPRGLPAGRMGLLSPSSIGGASPRHTLTSPALAAQGRQVSFRPASFPRLRNGRSHRGSAPITYRGRKRSCLPSLNAHQRNSGDLPV